MSRKIKTILKRTLAVFSVLLFLLIGFIFFATQSFLVQTWLAQKASSYLSSELGADIKVEKVKLVFFRQAELQDVLVLDRHKDTLLAGNILVKLNKLDWRHQALDVSNIKLSNTVSKIILYRGEPDFNYQFIADYFSSGDSSSTGTAWDVKVQSIDLDNASLVYRIEERAGAPRGVMDYDDIGISDINGHIINVRLDSNTILADIKNLNARERCGLHLKDFDTKAAINPKFLVCNELSVTTNNSFIKGELRFDYSNWESYYDFINEVDMKVTFLEGTTVTCSDIGFFATEMQGFDTRVSLKGNARGKVNDFNLKNFRLAFGKESLFLGDISFTGLPETEGTFVHMNAKTLSTSYTDLSALPAWPFNQGNRMQLPEQLRTLGLVTYSGKLDGFLSDFTTYGKLSSRLGSAVIQLSVSEKKEGLPGYKGRVQTFGFNLGKLIGVSDLGNVNMDLQVHGSGIEINTLDAELVGKINQLEYNKYTYKDIEINGIFAQKLFNGLLASHDPNADFDFNGTVNFQKEVAEMDFVSNINRLNLHELNFTGKRDSGYFSGQLLIDINGNSVDDITGIINLQHAVYRTPGKSYRLDNFNIILDQDSPEKKITLRSEPVNAYMTGSFALSNLGEAFQSVLYHYYPTFFRKPVKPHNYSDHFELTVNFRQINDIADLLVPGLRVANGSVLEAEFDARNQQLNVQVNSSRIGYGILALEDLHLLINESSNIVLAEVSGKSMRVGDSLGFKNFNFVTRSLDKDTRYTFDWDNLKIPANKGIVMGQLTFENEVLKLKNDQFNVVVNDSSWTLASAQEVHYYRDGVLEVTPLLLINNAQQLSVQGRLSHEPQDSLVIGMEGIVLRQLNPLLQLWKLSLEGKARGHVALSRPDSNLVFTGDLVMEQLTVNSNNIGALNLRTQYSAGDHRVLLDGFTSLGAEDENGDPVKNITFNGSYDLSKKGESINIDFAAKPANLKLLNPYLEDIITIKHAYINGEGRVHGDPANVKIDGTFKLFNSEIKVDYTNVSYHVTGLIEVMPDQIRFSDLLLREKGTFSTPQGTVNGNIFHNNFAGIRIDYDVTYRNMLVLNTSEKDNSLFYGRMYGSGNAGIYGFVNDLHMVITDTTMRNSQFVLPLDGPAEIGESDFIHFVKKDTVKTRARKTLTGFDLDLAIRATPAVEGQIILDKQHGDMLRAKGEGDLRLRINTLGKFEMFGDYVITDGEYLFTLENVINKKFEIDPGSSISWSGNPYNAEIDVVTRYRQRTSIAPLLADTTGTYKARVPVDCKLLISGKLFSPQIKFEIELPNVEANARARIASVLSDETELNRQVFSFLLFRSFVTPQIFNLHSGGVSAGGAAASTGSEMLSNRVSEFLNTYFGSLTGISDLQLGLNYRPGSQNNTDAVDLALSKQFLNNKITVDGNFGVNSSGTQSRQSGGLIGDVNIDYKISEDGRYRLKGFNRSNDITQITTAGGPYTQGVGFFYREEFETFQQLLNRYLKKKKKTVTPTP